MMKKFRAAIRIFSEATKQISFPVCVLTIFDINTAIVAGVLLTLVACALSDLCSTRAGLQ